MLGFPGHREYVHRHDDLSGAAETIRQATATPHKLNIGVPPNITSGYPLRPRKVSLHLLDKDPQFYKINAS
ncbi:MAG: hypothetical protein IPP17_04355 [Bacteroidetes bacterium]|nr:hypothetical protein [Bacteroidota bacterium]